MSGDVTEISEIYSTLARQVACLLNSDREDEDALKLSLGRLGVVNEIINLDFNKARRDAAAGRGGVCLIAAGEPTVVVKGKGRGGRNQQLALQFAVEVMILVLINVWD